MNSPKNELKLAILKKVTENLQIQIKETKNQLKQLFQAGAEEGKSSAGDKYETQREMIKQSRDQLDNQLARTQKMLEQIKRIPTNTQSSVQEGALFRVPMGWILVSVSLGKLEMEGQEYHLISRDSPLYLAFKDKKVGESVLFRGKDLMVEGLV